MSPGVASEETEKLRNAWLIAEEKYEKSSNEHTEKLRDKAWFAYMATKSSGVEKLPDTITTKNGSDGYYLTCAEGHE